MGLNYNSGPYFLKLYVYFDEHKSLETPSREGFFFFTPSGVDFPCVKENGHCISSFCCWVHSEAERNMS